MKKLICISFFFFLLFVTQTVLSQDTGFLIGNVKDENGAPIGFATIAVVQTSDTAIVTGTVADEHGQFNIKTPTTGSYFLRVNALGFAALETPVFEITGVNFNKNFGDIILIEDVVQLQEVSVESMRPTITQEADRMVVNIEGTALAAGNTAYAVLSKVPGVFIDQDGNIQLNGKSGVAVMINEKLTYLSARDLRNMLEGMSAENIKSIEVITNPSAKYDAEGTSGILNINLKKDISQGMSGSVYTGYNYNFKQHGYSTGGNIHFKKGRWNSFLSLDAARRVGGREATFTRIFYGTDQTTYFDQVATGNYISTGPPSVRLGTDFELNPRHSIGFMANYTTNKFESEFLTDTYIGSAPSSPLVHIDAENYNRNTYTNYTTNLHYVAKLDTVGTVISTDLDYVKIINGGEANFYNYFTDLSTGLETKDFLYTNFPGGFDIYSAKLDFALPFTKERKLELGAKASRVVSDNDSRFYFNNDEQPVLDLSRTNHFIYTESIYAAYVNWNSKLGENLTLQAGLRAEQTDSEGNSLTTGEVTNRRYFDLFPSVFVQQKINENYGINYSYSRRLIRPNYGALNPFRAYRDPYTWYQGNPYLRPQYTNSFRITQTYKEVYNLTLNYEYNIDVMGEIPILDVENATTIYTTGNLDNENYIGITGRAPLLIAEWWDSQNTLVLSYSRFSTISNNGPLVNEQIFSMLQSNHTLQLPLEVRMELNLLLRGPAASGLYHIAPMHRVDIGFRRSFLEKKIELSLSGNDLFKGYRYYWTTDINGNVNEFDQYFRVRSINVSLRYNFSKGEAVEKRRNTNLEELNRTN
ncbi:outer membrane beta-barrel family protein [Nafulsella turpanensis]|uniref:outer membrane beta-barrel family protein n=1 Tax=Nafulsella turpanensis TaxID=1265690 RepID=UPI000347E008|nr:outer membrane beta-barrel family protein [Nafulsella turpanensis]